MYGYVISKPLFMSLQCGIMQKAAAQIAAKVKLREI